MAILSNASPLNGMTGVVGGLLFRNINGKTVVSAYEPPAKRKKTSALQQRTRATFAQASQYAKAVTRDPYKYQYYKKRAKQLGVSSAYTAAITDFMRKAKIEAIDTSKAAKRGEITITTSEKGLPLANLQIEITTQNGQILAKGNAVKAAPNKYVYRHHDIRQHAGNITVTVQATDQTGNVVAWKQQRPATPYQIPIYKSTTTITN